MKKGSQTSTVLIKHRSDSSPEIVRRRRTGKKKRSAKLTLTNDQEPVLLRRGRRVLLNAEGESYYDRAGSRDNPRSLGLQLYEVGEHSRMADQEDNAEDEKAEDEGKKETLNSPNPPDNKPDETKGQPNVKNELPAATSTQTAPEPGPTEDKGKPKENNTAVATKSDMEEHDIMKELAKAEMRAEATAKMINDIRRDIAIYSEKENISEEDAVELQKKQVALMEKLSEFELITKRVQELMGVKDIPPEETRTAPTSDPSSSEIPLEDALPKVIVCGLSGHNEVPKIIVCERTSNQGDCVFRQFEGDMCPDRVDPCASRMDQYNMPMPMMGPPFNYPLGQSGDGNDERRYEEQQAPVMFPEPPVLSAVPLERPKAPITQMQQSTGEQQLLGRLGASYKMQEKLARENAKMESVRFELQTELLKKEQKIDKLQKQIENLRSEMKLLQAENDTLRNELEKEGIPTDCDQILCQAEADMETIKEELRGLLEEKKTIAEKIRQLEMERIPSRIATTKDHDAQSVASKKSTQSLPINYVPRLESQFLELKQRYKQLQCDFNEKVGEISVLQIKLDSTRRDSLVSLEKAEEAEARADELLDKLKSIEQESSKRSGTKDGYFDMEQQLFSSKQKLREAQEEIEEMRCLVQEQTSQLDDYRTKYLTAQETVEEQRHQIDILTLENSKISDQVNTEIQRMKAQFQDRIQHLSPLSDLLKATQMSLKEAQQLRMVAEQNCEELSRENEDLRGKNSALLDTLEKVRSNKSTSDAERTNLLLSLSEGEKKCEELFSDNTKLKSSITRVQKQLSEAERKLDEKCHEVVMLQQQLEMTRDEANRQVTKVKERCEAAKRALQTQVSDLERQVAQSRALAKATQKEKDEARVKMQAQFAALSDKFEQSQLRIRSLQSHINYLKTSYTNIFAPDRDSSLALEMDDQTFCLPPTDGRFFNLSSPLDDDVTDKM